MVSFVETATLKLNDQSSAAINKINANLKKLFATANALKGTKSLGLNVNLTRLAQAEAQVKRLTAELKNLKSAAGSVKINVNASGLAQASNQINKLHAQARKPITLRTVAGAATAYGATAYAGRALREGTKAADVGTTNLNLLQLDETRRRYANEQVAEAERRLRALPGPMQFNTAQIEQRMAEALREVREGEAAKALRIPLDPSRPQDVGDPKRSRAATAAEAQAESQRRMRVAQERVYQEMITADQIAKDTGVSAGAAVEKIKGFYKALDMAGWLSDESGQNTAENIKRSGDFIRTLRSSIGEEATGEFLRNLIRREKAAKFALTERGQLTLANIAEDMGAPTAGTAFSTWANQVQGARITSAAREAQFKAGLAVNGKWVGKGMNKKFIADTVDAALAQTDPLAYARARYVPALQKMGMTEQQIFSNKPEDIAAMSNNMRKLYSDTNAANFAITLMTHLLELESKARDAATRKSDPETMAKATENSVQASVNAMNSAVQGVLGQAVVAVAPAISAVSNALATGIASAATDIKTAGDPTKSAAERITAGEAAVVKIGAAVGTAGATLYAFNKVMQATGAAAIIGKASAISAMTSKDESARAMGGAGYSLIEAAEALKGAASDLSGAAGKMTGLPGGVEPPGGPDKTERKGPQKPEPKKMDPKARGFKLWESLKNLPKGKIGAGLGGLLAGVVIGEVIEQATSPTAGRTPRQTRQLEEERALAVARNNNRMITLEVTRAEKAAAAAKPGSTAEQAEVDRLKVLQRRIQDEITQRERRVEKMPGLAPGEKLPPYTPEAAEKAAPLASAEAQAEAASKISEASTALSGTSQLFAQAFSTGAQQISAAGQAAADHISAGAASAGAAYGSAAAAQIRAAVANVNVNVNVKGGGGDTGNINNANGNK